MSPDPVPPDSTTIEFIDEGVASPRTMVVSEALARAVARAASVGTGSFPVSFSSLFVGLLADDDPTGEWLRNAVQRYRADTQPLLRKHSLTWFGSLRQAAPRGADDAPPQPFRRTTSARQALEEAERIAGARSADVTDTRHVLLAFLKLPGYHESDFEELHIDRAVWASDFELTEYSRLNAEAAARRQASTPDFDPLARDIEPHVKTALQYAHALAGSDRIHAGHVITAVVRLAKTVDSSAFGRAAKLVPLATDKGPVPAGDSPGVLDFDANLLEQLARAQRPLPGAHERTPLWGRDLITAALLTNDDSIEHLLEGSDLSLDEIRERWYVFVTSSAQHRKPADWTAWWREADMPLPGPRRAGYATETDQGEDKLGVDGEAHAFARLILDKDVQAPLSIGLLGDWGSGKSFFIEQIRKAVKELKDQGRPELYSHVVEIEFNAWHASDSNLWASLVTNIFDAIWNNVSESKGDLKAAQEQLRKEIEQAQGAVHEAETQVQSGQQALETAEKDLQQKRETLAWNRFVSSWSSTTLQALAKSAGWHESLETINDVDKAARSLVDSGSRLRLIVSALLEKPLLRIALPTAAVLALTAAVWVVVDTTLLSGWATTVTKVLTTVAGIAGAVAAPLGIARQKVDRLSTTLEGIHGEYERQLAVVKTQNSQEADAVTKARRELESTEASVAAARARLAELLNQQATLDPRRRLGAFLEERVQSTQYRSQQGIISLVHRDFSALSNYMRDLRESAAAADEGPPPEDAAGPAATKPKRLIKPFDRIVLYVDDLDRCRPAHVVNMLEAVHLLLALDLFVVVVAVDSRWLSRSLEVYYHDLLTGAAVEQEDGLRASTPQSYLEKIFQITYALGPMNPKQFGRYVDFLAGAEGGKQRRAKAAAGDGDKSATGVARVPPASDAGVQSGVPALTDTVTVQTQDNGPSDAISRQERRARARAHALSVSIGDDERAFIGRLVPLLPTPRIAKRLVNVYRVIKAAKTVEELEEFEHQGRARSCLLMLAILFGRPTIAAPLLRGLHERTAPFDVPDEALVAALRRRVPTAEEPASVRTTWERLVVTLEAIGISETVADCSREPKEVARYSLVSGHDWHTWNDPPAVARKGQAATMIDGNEFATT